MMMKWTLAAEETKGVFEALKQKPTNKSELPAECVNLKQNRHFDVLPNPTTRVMLTQTAGGVASTYYNANYMPAEDGAAKRYICAQGPMADTVADFWRMVVEHGVRSVVMATGVEENGRSKCARYWPEPSCSQTYGGWTVVSGEVSQGPGFKTTKLTVTHASLTARGPHDVTHFWFDTWKDHSTPKTADGTKKITAALIALQEAVDVHERSSGHAHTQARAPIISHCSAGVGRSGSFVAYDMALRKLQRTGQANLPVCCCCLAINKIRQSGGFIFLISVA